MEITVLKAICREISAILPGLKLAALDEGGSGELYLSFKAPGQRHTLLINPRPGTPRLHLTTRAGRAGRSKTPTPFAHSLSNHITAAALDSVTQEGLERAVLFHFTRKTAKRQEKSTLVLEMAGKKPNLILLDEDGKILLAQSYVPLSDEALRPVLPGLAYQLPPLPDRLDPFAATEADIVRIILENPGLPPDKALLRHVGGISPLLASEVAASAVGLEAGRIVYALRALLSKVEEGPYEPCVYETPKGPVLSAIELRRLGGYPRMIFSSMNEAAEVFYTSLTERQRFAAARDARLREIRAKLSAAGRKLAAIEADLARADSADTYQHFGNLLMASLGSVPEGAESVELPDLFLAGAKAVTVPLDPKLSPVKNAEFYFIRARKARAGVGILRGRLEAARHEVENLKALMRKAEEAQNIEGLPAPGGDISVKGKGLNRPGRSRAEAVPEFPRFVSSDGYEVIYGKNAKLNDILTFKLAEPMDLWLHAQGYHGAHVIVRNPDRRKDIPLQTILEAAGVAAYISGARKDSSVAVDYTFRKYVRKPRDPVPGQAIFTNNKTVFVEPKKPAGQG